MTIVEQIIDLVKWGGATYGTLILKDYLAKRRSKKNPRVNNMDVDYARRKRVQPILDEARYELEVDRVMEIVFSNGDVTLSGHHLKKLSVFLESYAEGLDPVGHQLQLVPTRKFQRNLDELYESSEDFCVSREDSQTDETGQLNRLFGIRSLLMVKVRNEFGKWVGVISAVSKDSEHVFTESDITFLKLQAAKIGGLR
jgi:hypothetical protein